MSVSVYCLTERISAKISYHKCFEANTAQANRVYLSNPRLPIEKGGYERGLACAIVLFNISLMDKVGPYPLMGLFFCAACVRSAILPILQRLNSHATSWQQQFANTALFPDNK